MNLETIVAEATPAGRGGVSIVRLSGPKVREIAEALLGQVPPPRLATFVSFKDEKQSTIDQGLALFFENPQSFTGEDVLELQGHGGPMVVRLLIRRCLTLGARLARPGEFSERAFLNGKIDLAQAEAIADLIHAGTEEAARSALRSLQGEFSKKIRALTETIIYLRLYIEAAIDFAEEEIDFLSGTELQQKFQQALSELDHILQNAKQGSLLREGITVVLAGKPNVGKSTLLNMLSGKELAIVTDIPGTTRDTLREHIQIDGLPLHLVDTAGLRESEDPIEQEGIRRARRAVEEADLLLYVENAKDPSPAIPQEFAHLPTIIVRNKIDLTQEKPAVETGRTHTTVSLSAKTNEGLPLLKSTLKSIAGFSPHTESIFSARDRHLDALFRTQMALKTAHHNLLHAKASELIAEDLRLCQQALNEITGEFTSDDLLGRIFSSFCIGK